MSLNIPSDQIYGGRYHYKSIEPLDILHLPDEAYTKEQKLLREEYPVDTVTFSDEGLAKSKDWREYTKDNPNMQHVNMEERREEINRQIHTTNLIDPVSMFNCEIGEVAEQLQRDNHLPNISGSWTQSQTVLAKTYQIIYDRIQEEFSDPERETTYLIQNDGIYVEETMQDRLDALNEAYSRRAQGAAAAAASLAEIANFTGQGSYSADFIEELKNKVQEGYQNAISEKNLERLRQKVTSFEHYSIDQGISSEWINVINLLLYGRR